jgi:CheY-like chemotaxis protein
VEAFDGRDALVKALVRPPAVVVAEIDLPLVDGVALCEILRRDRVTATVPILVLAPDTDAVRAADARRAGADVVLSRKTSLQLLLTETERLLSVARTLRGRSADARRRVASELKRSAELLRSSARHPRTTLTRAHQRFMTTTPPSRPPELRCPVCDRPLRYTASHVGGVSAQHPEQWDYFECDSCGEFRYRQRTRKLRRID